MDFTADYQPYSADSPGTFMEFTAEFSPLGRKRRRTSSSHSSSRPPSSHSISSRPPTKRPLSRQPSHALATPRTYRRAGLLLVLLVGALAVLLLPGLALLPSSPRHSLPSHHYLSIVDESRLEVAPTTRLASQEAAEEAANLKEAHNSLGAAMELRRGGNLGKARRVFRHALSLAPRDPAVLLHYGELLQQGEEVVEADHYYARAIAYSAAGSALQSKALELRQATASRVQTMDDAVLARIDGKKAKFLEVKADSAAMRRAKKEAYFQYIYHTVGIEGNTLSLAQTRAILETRLAVVGKSIMEHNEILGMEAALMYINNTLVDKWGDITIQDILEIHRRVIGNVDPVEAGMFRRSQVFVSNHQPPPPSLLSVLMGKFVTWLNSGQDLHPVRHAALAHYKLVFIHPFMDGNGRTSRLLMNLILMRAGFPPVIVRRADREVYYRHLQAANEGDIRPFIRFIALCTEKTLDAYLWASQEYTMEVEAGEAGVLAELPPNLVEDTMEEVVTGVRRYRATRASHWLNFAEEEEEEEGSTIRLGDGGRGEEVLLTMDEQDVQ